MDRRAALRLIGGAAAAVALRCTTAPDRHDPSLAQLAARPQPQHPNGNPTGGIASLGIGAVRDGVFFAAPAASGPTPLLLMLHGAGGRGSGILTRAKESLPERDIVVVAPDSRAVTWMRPNVADDVRFIDAALEAMFARYDIDRSRVFIAGHSDGASWALSLGVTNGDLFSRAVAFSPGYLAVQAPSLVRPKIFIAHGTHDDILPIDTTGRRVAIELRRAGYSVTFREFDGDHRLQPAIVREAMTWLRA